MKAKLKFELPEENDLYRQSLHGPDYHSVIENLLNKFREVIKYGNSDFNQDEAEKWREFLLSELNDYCVSHHFF